MEERMMNRLTVKQGVERSYKGMHALQISLHFGLCLKMLLALAIAALAHTTQVQAYDGEYQWPSHDSPNRCTVEVLTSSDLHAGTTATIDMLIWFPRGHTYRWHLDKRGGSGKQRGAKATYHFGSLYDGDGRDANNDGWPDVAPYLNLRSDGRDDGWLWKNIKVTCFAQDSSYVSQPIAAWQWQNLGFNFSDFKPIWIFEGWYHFYQGTPVEP
jgi:hypothetical protein